MSSTASTSKPMIAARSLGRLLKGGSTPRRPARRAVEDLVIVGNGPASFRLCERLTSDPGRQVGKIIVFGEEPRPAYDRVHLTRFLNERSADDLLYAPASWYASRGIILHTGDRVVAIDRERRSVRSAIGREVPFDKLVLATGSRAFVPTLQGSDLPGVFVYRTLEDLERILARAEGRRRAVVLGGGLLGLEIATALRALELETWVVERGVSLLTRQLDPEAGKILQAHIERLRVRILTQRETERIESVGDDLLVQFSTGECLRTHLIIIAAGIRPRDELGADCGLKLGPRGGIAIDDTLKTSDPAIHAIGECAAHRGVVYGLAGPALAMAETLGDIFLGRPRRFTGADTSAWLKVPGLSVAALGDHQANVETLSVRTEQGCRRIVMEGGRLIGAVAIGEWPEQSRIHSAILERRRIWRWQKARFVAHGRIWRDDAPLPVAQWPERALVCTCRGVSRQTLSAACAGGCRTVQQLAEATGASTVCGSCIPFLHQLLGEPQVPARRVGMRWLLVASLLAAAAVIALAFTPAIPFENSVQNPWSLDLLWRSSAARQVTGFTALALMLIGMGFSFRKRIKRFQLGDVNRWRAFHATLGVLTLVAIATHTGFRLGYNFNRVLMLNFLAIAVTGSLAGLVTSVANRLTGPAGTRLRAAWNATHLAITWPLPVLILFHVLTAYYF